MWIPLPVARTASDSRERASSPRVKAACAPMAASRRPSPSPPLGETDVFVDPLAHLAAAVAVGHLVAEDPPQADFLEGLLQGFQRAADEAGRGMMIDHRGGAGPNGFDRPDEAAVVQDFLVDGPVQAPPEILQDGHEVRGRLDVGQDSPGQRRIEMVVAADDARADQVSRQIDGPHRRGIRREVPAYLDNPVPVDQDVQAFVDLWRQELQQASIFQ